jgi:hypothetical protein
MQGSLDQPPVIIKADRIKASIGLVGALIVALGIWYFTGAHPHTFYFACMAAFVCGAILLTSPTMTVTPDGLSWGSVLGRNSWPWSDFDGFEVRQVPIFGIECLGCRFSATHPGGPDGVIGLLWEMPVGDLTLLLNDARARWSRPPLAVPAASG